MRKLQSISIGDPDRTNFISEIGGIGIVNMLVTDPDIVEEFGEMSNLTLLFQAGTAISVDDKTHLKKRRVIRLNYDDGSFWEWRIVSKIKEHEGTRDTMVEAVAIWADLGDRRVRRDLSDGSVFSNIPFYSIRADDLFQALLGSDYNAPSYFVFGSIHADLEDQKISLLSNNATHLEVIQEACQELNSEWYTEWNDTTSVYEVHFVPEGSIGNAVGDENDRPIQMGGGLGNRIRLERRAEEEFHFSIVVPVGGSDNETFGIQDAEFDIQNQVYDSFVNETFITLKQRPIAEVGYPNLPYFGHPVTGWNPVKHTIPPAVLIFDGQLPEQPKGQKYRFALDNTGTKAPYIEDAEAVEVIGEVESDYRRPDITPFPNLLAGYDVSADLSEFSSGMPVGTEALGASTIAEETDPLHIKYGQAAVNISGDNGQGIQTKEINIQPTDERPYFSVWVAGKVISGGYRVELIDSEGIVHPLNNTAESTSTQTTGISVSGIEPASGLGRIQVVLTQDQSEIVLDAWTLVQSAYAREYTDRMGANSLFIEASKYLRDEGGLNSDLWEARFYDQAYSDETFQEVQIGDYVRVRDSWDGATFEIDFVGRVIELSYRENEVDGRVEKTAKLVRRGSKLDSFFANNFVSKRSVQSRPSIETVQRDSIPDGTGGGFTGNEPLYVTDGVEFVSGTSYDGSEQRTLRAGETWLNNRYMRRDQNGADINDPSVFRSNLGLGNLATMDSLSVLSAGNGLQFEVGTGYDGMDPRSLEIDESWNANFASLSIGGVSAIDSNRNFFGNNATFSGTLGVSGDATFANIVGGSITSGFGDIDIGSSSFSGGSGVFNDTLIIDDGTVGVQIYSHITTIPSNRTQSWIGWSDSNAVTGAGTSAGDLLLSPRSSIAINSIRFFYQGVGKHVFDANGATIGANTLPTKTLDVNGTLGVSGNATLDSNLDVSGTATVNVLDVTTTSKFGGDATFNSNIAYFGGIQSDSFAVVGGLIEGTDLTQAGYLRTATIETNALVAKAFTAEVSQLFRGERTLSKSFAELAEDFEIPAVGFTDTITIHDVDGFTGFELFGQNDIVELRPMNQGDGLVLGSVFGRVTNVVDNLDGTQSWTFETLHVENGALAGQTVYAGSEAKSYGSAANPVGVIQDSVFANVPYSQGYTWSTNPWTVGNRTIQYHLGDLDEANVTGVSGVGLYTKRGFLEDDILIGKTDKSASYLEVAGDNINAVGLNLDVTSLPRINDEGLVGLLKMDSVVDGKAFESIDGETFSSSNLSVSLQTSILEKSYLFDGSEITLPNVSKYRPDQGGIFSNESWYVSFWISPLTFGSKTGNACSDDRALVIGANNDGANYNDLRITNGGHLRYSGSVSLITEINLNEWSHVVLQHDSNTNTLSLWVNSEERASASTTSNPINTHASFIKIGGGYTIGCGSDTFYHGYMNLMRIGNRPLSLEEIKSLYLYPSGNSGGLISANQVRTGQIQSENYVAGTSPFTDAGTLIDLNNGDILSEQFGIVNGNATFAGNLSAAGGTFAGTLQAVDGEFSGTLSAVDGEFTGNLSAVGGTFTGTLSAVDGTFTGTLSAPDGDFGGWTIASNNIWNVDGIFSTILANGAGRGVELQQDIGGSWFDAVKIQNKTSFDESPQVVETVVRNTQLEIALSYENQSSIVFDTFNTSFEENRQYHLLLEFDMSTYDPDPDPNATWFPGVLIEVETTSGGLQEYAYNRHLSTPDQAIPLEPQNVPTGLDPGWKYGYDFAVPVPADTERILITVYRGGSSQIDQSEYYQGKCNATLTHSMPRTEIIHGGMQIFRSADAYFRFDHNSFVIQGMNQTLRDGVLTLDDAILRLVNGSKINHNKLPTSPSGMHDGDFYTQTADQIGGTGSTKVVCVV